MPKNGGQCSQHGGGGAPIQGRAIIVAHSWVCFAYLARLKQRGPESWHKVSPQTPQTPRPPHPPTPPQPAEGAWLCAICDDMGGCLPTTTEGRGFTFVVKAAQAPPRGPRWIRSRLCLLLPPHAVVAFCAGALAEPAFDVCQAHPFCWHKVLILYLLNSKLLSEQSTHLI